VRLCMFHPLENPMKRGWVGRVDGDHVIHLAAQTLQAFFTGGGAAREHAVYALDGVRLLAPVLYPPAVRVFDAQETFEFANPAAIVGPGSDIERRGMAASSFVLRSRLAAVIGAGGEIGGFTALADWRDEGRRPPKDRDFALGLGPLVVTPDELDLGRLSATVRVDGRERAAGRFGPFDWTGARDLAADGTVLRPGDLLAGPASGIVESISPGSSVELAVEGIGVLSQTVVGH
jgi:Fumarylacetoacetate (FAA) hydrolase family